MIKLLKSFFLLWLLWAAGTISIHAAPTPVDPLMGDWFYYKNRPVVIKADGTAERKEARGVVHGTWEYLHNPEVQRHYRIIWEHGLSIDILVLSEDAQRGHVTYQGPTHAQYDVWRVTPDKPAASPTATPAAQSPGYFGASGR